MVFLVYGIDGLSFALQERGFPYARAGAIKISLKVT